jgi:hypothetical protein
MPIGITFGGDTSVYKRKAIISSFIMPHAGPDNSWSEDLAIKCDPIIPNTASQDITITTYFQTLTLVTFTYLMIDISSMIPLPLVYY